MQTALFYCIKNFFPDPALCGIQREEQKYMYFLTDPLGYYKTKGRSCINLYTFIIPSLFTFQLSSGVINFSMIIALFKINFELALFYFCLVYFLYFSYGYRRYSSQVPRNFLFIVALLF